MLSVMANLPGGAAHVKPPAPARSSTGHYKARTRAGSLDSSARGPGTKSAERTLQGEELRYGLAAADQVYPPRVHHDLGSARAGVVVGRSSTMP